VQSPPPGQPLDMVVVPLSPRAGTSLLWPKPLDADDAVEELYCLLPVGPPKPHVGVGGPPLAAPEPEGVGVDGNPAPPQVATLASGRGTPSSPALEGGKGPAPTVDSLFGISLEFDLSDDDGDAV
jgi:hypothetical protein